MPHTTAQRGAGLFDMRSLSTKTLWTLHDALDIDLKAENELCTMTRRILIERQAEAK